VSIRLLCGERDSILYLQVAARQRHIAESGKTFHGHVYTEITPRAQPSCQHLWPLSSLPQAQTSIKAMTMHVLSPMHQQVVNLSGIRQAWGVCGLDMVFGVGVEDYDLSNSEHLLAGGRR